MAPDEESPLLPSRRESEPENRTKRRRDKLAVYGSFIGVFLAAADESIVLSTWSLIASQFHRLSQGSWLLAAYNFGYCVSLPAYGALCEIYGRKSVLLGAYALFAVGCFACGASTSLLQLILARVLAGISGGGMVSLVSIIITDLAPADEVALLRSYANVVNVAGRSLGAPIGGLLIGAVGWRWSFLGQLPLVAICILVLWYGFPSASGSTENSGDANEERTARSIISQLDIGGLFSLSAIILLLLLIVQNLSAADDSAAGLTILVPAFFAAVLLFIATEGYWARNPLIPLHLLKTSLGGYGVNQVLILFSRSGLMSNLAPYLIRVENAPDSYASSAYVLAAVGVSIGGLIAGAIIKRRKKYTTMAGIAICGTALSYLIIFVSWRAGCSPWELLYLFPNGMFIGALFTTQFVGMSMGVPKENLSTCITTYYLCQQLGCIIGPATNVALVQRIFGEKLEKLDGWEEKRFIGQILNDDRFAQRLPAPVQDLVRSSYLNAFQLVPLISGVCSLMMLPTWLWERGVGIV
ncbi:hypothetical protein SI65_00660 [Aspergillus cristatus]|uniref:Major facilitator superfamily (MFS) profile domain-containing protein n=1 Tax=Aspergillus cristatus TaxID=573508 RepID=A0A1E3BQK9_ASPCR|nr:hypothetical protein SI65_00660 [Aspergillus cristatus]